MFDSGPLKDDRECSASAASIETGPTIDSAIGESISSKRSSLDRKSQTSFVDWASDVESHCSPKFADDDGLPEEGEGSCEGERPQRCSIPKKKLPLPSISLPRGLFSRSKQAALNEHSTYSSTSWRFFADKRPMKDPNVVSTMGLILETRPSNLPAKSEEEEAKHRAQYLELIEQARKKEAREAKERKRAAELQRRLEDQAAAACHQWSENILPKWEEMRNTKRCRELWWQGIPSKVRGRVWSLVIGNELNLTEELYNICCLRALERISAAKNGEASEGDDSPLTMHRASLPGMVEDSSLNQSVNRESTVELIHLDVSRTFPTLGIFQKGGPYYDLLLKLLGAYVCYRPDVGYVQSMSFVAAVLLLQMDPYDAFIAFANLLNRPLQVSLFTFLRFGHVGLKQLVKDVYAFFYCYKIGICIVRVYTLYAKSLPLDVTCRVWDMFLRDGEEFLFKTALGILRLYERQLLEMDFEEVVQFLTHLPETMTSTELFRNIEPFMRSYASTAETTKCKRRFLQILADVNERINPGSSLGSSDRLSGSASSKGLGDGASQSQLSQLSTNMQNLKMSKSLSGFLGDLLKPPLPAHVVSESPSMRRSPTCPLSNITAATTPSSTQCTTTSSSSSR
uniref:Rab-GAP TBC domain-containing protein n=1 Tax=Ascaris lumbricoides TaxID=6252 RepID=A0A9J2P5X1_ASCLU